MALDYFNIKSVDTYSNPLATDGQLIHALNTINFPSGGMSKRGGYRTLLNNPDGAQVNALFAFSHQDGTTLQVYRAAGSLLYYSLQGTSNWAVAKGSAGTDAGGTIVNGNFVDFAILNNVCIIADGGTVRHTTNGTAFVNTVNAPLNSQYVTQYHQRIYASDGTSSTLTYSSYGSADNWLIALPADSSSFTVPSDGAITKSFVAGDRLTIPKNKGRMFNWDDTTLVDMSTIYGPTSPRSIQQIDDYWFYVHQLGIFGFDGANKSVISNPIQRQFYNRLGVNVSGVNLINNGNALGAAFWWDYLAVVGNVNDDFTGKIINNAIIKYDYQKNAFVDWQFSDFPTAITSYYDTVGHQQLIFGDANGDCFQYDPGATSDNGKPIASEMVFLFTYASEGSSFTPTSAASLSGQSWQKRWKYLRAFFTPGCEINCQFAFSDSLAPQRLKWSEAFNTRSKAGPSDYWQFSDGVLEIRFPNDSNNLPRSRFLFVRYYESSDSSQWTLYGQQIDAEPQIVS